MTKEIPVPLQGIKLLSQIAKESRSGFSFDRGNLEASRKAIEEKIANPGQIRTVEMFGHLPEDIRVRVEGGELTFIVDGAGNTFSMEQKPKG